MRASEVILGPRARGSDATTDKPRRRALRSRSQSLPMDRSDHLPSTKLRELAHNVDAKLRLESEAEQARPTIYRENGM